MGNRYVHRLALTVWLAIGIACDGVEGPAAQVTVADSADEVVYGVVHNVTIDGVLRVRVEADTAYFYEGSQSAELKQVRAVFHTLNGLPSTVLTSREGTYEWRSGNMEARIDVVGRTPDGRRLTTSILRYDKLADRLIGDQPFVFDAPDRHLEGNGFISDPDFRDVQATGVSGRARN